jgi:exosortase E/protease (VPEID-CTERM system)
VWLDGAALSGRSLLAASIGRSGAWILRFVVTFSFLFLILTYLTETRFLRAVSDRCKTTPLAPRYLAGHFLTLATFCVLSRFLFRHGATIPSDLVAVGWLVSGLAAVVLAFAAFLPVTIWRDLHCATGNLWLFPLAGSVAANLLGEGLRSLWTVAAQVTFQLVRVLLTPFISPLVVNPKELIIGSPAFQVSIAPQCSGLEGVALIAIFGCAWLWLLRRECRFPHALLLVPAGMVTAFLLNSVRIAALVLIGNAGAPDVAAGGFHSQFGWIAFNVVALGLLLGAHRLPWMRVKESDPVKAADEGDNPAVGWLAPFVAILAAAMVSRAASSGFEWLYPLRFLAGVLVIAHFRRRYRELDWGMDWMSVGAGLVVFAMWVALDRLHTGTGAGGLATGLNALSPASRLIWLFFRALAAVTTVPFAEELAFRGFVMRRLVSSDFEAVDFRRAPMYAVLVSSLLFGIMHGDRWIAGTVAGLIYALAVRRRGSLGSAIAAHAITNGLLAVWVVTRGEWGFW